MRPQEILDKLIEEEKIVQEDIDEIVDTMVAPEARQAVDLIHLLLCKSDHDTECEYYKEEEMAGTWQRTWHKDWIAKAHQHYNSDQLKTAIEDIRRVSEIKLQFDRLLGGGKSIVFELLNAVSIST